MGQCKQCGGGVPDNVTTCPVCGSAVTAQSHSGDTRRSISRDRIIVIAIVVVVFILMMVGFSQCFRSGESSAIVSQSADLTEKFKVDIDIECEENFLLSRYDINVFLDGNSIGSIDHGAQKSFSESLVAGRHTLRIEKKDSSSVDGSIEFEVLSDTHLRLKLKCTSDQVEIEMIDDLASPISSTGVIGTNKDELCQRLADVGFKNVKTEEVKDLAPDQRDKVNTVVAVFIGDSERFAKDEKFFADVEIVVKHHQLQDINPPYGSDEVEGLSYQEVVSKFQETGFAHVETDQKTTSDASKDGTVRGATIGWHSTFSMDDVFWPDEKVSVGYWHYDGDADKPAATNSSSTEDASVSEVLTVDNCVELSTLMSAPDGSGVGQFASDFKGKRIEFDGNIAHVMNHGSFNTRFDVLLYSGNYSENGGPGPAMKFEDKSTSDMGIKDLYPPSWVEAGTNVHVIAEVVEYNTVQGLLKLDPISITQR